MFNSPARLKSERFSVYQILADTPGSLFVRNGNHDTASCTYNKHENGGTSITARGFHC